MTHGSGGGCDGSGDDKRSVETVIQVERQGWKEETVASRRRKGKKKTGQRKNGVILSKERQ